MQELWSLDQDVVPVRTGSILGQLGPVTVEDVNNYILVWFYKRLYFL